MGICELLTCCSRVKPLFCLQHIGMEELGEDPDFATNSLRVTNRERLLKILTEKLVTLLFNYLFTYKTVLFHL